MNIKRRLKNDNGIAPIIAMVVLIVGCAIAGGVLIAAYQLTVKPDITYNIEDTGFALAGIDTTTWYVIAGVIVVIGIMYFASRRKPDNPRY